jgi:hypothetical protein
MFKLILLTLLAAATLSGCADLSSFTCGPNAFRGCGGPVDPVYPPFYPMPQADHIK